MGVALACCLSGSVGVASALKRGRGIRDWGRLIKGHGGMLDRVDSLPSRPVFFYVVKVDWAP